MADTESLIKEDETGQALQYTLLIQHGEAGKEIQVWGQPGLVYTGSSKSASVTEEGTV